MQNFRSLRWLAVVLWLALFILASSATLAQDTRMSSFFTTTDGHAVNDDYFFKLVRDNIDASTTNLNFAFSVCFSGGFVDDINFLSGDWSVTAASEINNASKIREFGARNSEKEGTYPPGVFVAGLGGSSPYLHGWGAVYLKQLSEDKNSTVKTLAQKAFDNDFFTPPAPKATLQYRSSQPNGDGQKVYKPNTTNRAVFFTSTRDELGVKLSAAAAPILRSAGFDPLADNLDFSVDDLKGKKIGGFEVARNADYASLKDAIKSIKGKENAFFFIQAHGNRESQAMPKKPAAAPAAPMQGKTYSAGDNGVSLPIDSSFAQSLQQEVPDGSGGFLSFDPDYTRTGPARFLLTTVNEAVHGSGEVDVLLNGILAGTIALGGLSTGYDYGFDLADETIRLLSPTLGSNYINVAFQFDDPLDSFQIATQEDMLYDPGFQFEHYGIGIAAGPANGNGPTIPEPSTLALLVTLTGLIILARQRKLASG